MENLGIREKLEILDKVKDDLSVMCILDSDSYEYEERMKSVLDSITKTYVDDVYDTVLKYNYGSVGFDWYSDFSFVIGNMTYREDLGSETDIYYHEDEGIIVSVLVKDYYDERDSNFNSDDSLDRYGTMVIPLDYLENPELYIEKMKKSLIEGSLKKYNDELVGKQCKINSLKKEIEETRAQYICLKYEMENYEKMISES